jgi:MFS family permease
MYGVITLPDVLSSIFIAAGALLLVIFLNAQMKTKYPVLMLSLFSGKTFRRSTFATFLNYGSAYAVLFSLSLYLQYIGGMGPGTAGLIILAQPAIQAVITPFAGKLSDKIDPRILTTSGMIMMCIGTLLMITLTEELVMLQVYAILIATGCGYALFSAPNTNVVMSCVAVKDYSESSGVLSLMRQVGMMTSIAIVMCMISVFLGTSTIVTPDVFGEFIMSIRYSFAVCFALAVIGCFMTWFSRDNNASAGISNH